ncbi:hypothetical protein EVU96_08650 [Bacillus infantis]|uniref:hypothetical protein n=1 Tax=Bacillus infantis TaxID=324767 RepID=UPI00101D8374|nr:hypothetical protein [Bacillus infantis]RYI30472.1 hypothetical protein EVU96_08650 [Bacillus infantis]
MDEMILTLIDLGESGYVYRGDKLLHYYKNTDPTQISDITSRLGYLVNIYYIESKKMKEAGKLLFMNYIPEHLSEWDFAIKRNDEDRAIPYEEKYKIDKIF